ncbi:MAG: sodium-translocating pyrophosphatase [Phycisphaeraceae bacterium]|nr:sodium-translocating pyrophosphatase [Phycisphaeraceae bacterium]
MQQLSLFTLADLSAIPQVFWLAPLGAVVALVMARVFATSVMKKSEGEPEMVRIADAVRKGAMAYLARQYKVVAGVFVLLVAFLAVMALLNLQSSWSVIGVPIAGLLSGLCGWFGMRMATNASARTAFAAKQSLNDGLTVAFRSGAVMGLVVVGFALLDISVWFIVFNATGMGGSLRELTTVMLSFGMGASTQALFARVGGGIYTKAADVGADLVGKVEAGIPEDDPRNPATIADNVGDNVGDVAGMGADLYESYYGSILATAALGAAAAFTIGNLTGDQTNSLALRLAAAPMALAGLGILCSILGVFTVKASENATFAQLLKGLHKGVYVASGLILFAAFGLLYFLFNNVASLNGVTTWWGLGLSILSGLLAGLVIAYATEYYTSYEHPPTRRIAFQALTGPATVIIAGIAEGMKSTWASLLTVAIAIIAAFTFAGGGENFLMGLYGVGIAAVGMLSTLGITLATDAYGPIADNAGGNAEMSSQPPHVRERTDMLDSLGNTTAATGKGFAIGSAALTALALFAAFIQVVQVQITTQSESFVRKGGFSAPASGAYAVYEGYGRFAIVLPGEGRDKKGGVVDYVDGGMFLPIGQSTEILDHLSVGQVFTQVHAEGEEHHGHVAIEEAAHLKAASQFTIHATFDHGSHGHDEKFVLASSRNGTLADVLAFYDVSLANPRLLAGMFIGVLLAFLFCALTMNAVGRAAYAMMGECRRQFAKMRQAMRAKGMSEEDVANPDNWPREGVDLDGQHYPDYANCVAISTAGAQKEMVVPSILAIIVPILVGLTLSVPGIMGLLAGGLVSGFAVAVFMANAGGAWDNAKKLLESFGKTTAQQMVDGTGNSSKVPAEVRESIMARAQEFVASGQGSRLVYGKGSDDHKATVVGDTVGDPFKDTSGPALNILIKLISIVSVVFAGLVVKFGPVVGAAIGLN